MSQDTRRCRPVRLCDLPIDIRLRGAKDACRVEPDPVERARILHHALVPSSRTYWIAA